MSTRSDDVILPAGTRPIAVRRLGEQSGPIDRPIVEEAPVEIAYAGQSYAVMMTTPCDLEDFAVGFTLSEQLARRAADITDIRLTETRQGWQADCCLVDDRRLVAQRTRQRVADSSCGLCGVSRLSKARRTLPPVRSRLSVPERALFRSLEALLDHQPMNQASGGVHAAAFVMPEGELALVREDVGRHNAFDKLIGAAARAGLDLTQGYALLSSRCSYELVEKAIIAGLPMLVTISAPTSLAVECAREHDLTLVALARHDTMLAINDPHQAIRSPHPFHRAS